MMAKHLVIHTVGCDRHGWDSLRVLNKAKLCTMRRSAALRQLLEKHFDKETMQNKTNTRLSVTDKSELVTRVLRTLTIIT